MRFRIVSTAIALAGAMALTACASHDERFEWGHYEGALYVYAKKPEKRADYKQALVEAIAKGRKENRVAPGLLAELGYVYLEDGDMASAIPLFEEEMKRFPESRTFLSGVVSRAKGGSSANVEAKPEVKS